jgi:hypothetical protein
MPVIAAIPDEEGALEVVRALFRAAATTSFAAPGRRGGTAAADGGQGSGVSYGGDAVSDTWSLTPEPPGCAPSTLDPRWYVK